MAQPEVTIWSQPSSGVGIEKIGSTSARDAGIVPEGVSYTWDQHGPSKANFSLRRQGGVPWPDLGALAAIDIDINGTRVWAGRISEAPQQTGDQNVINVVCEGWQYHLEDDLTTKLYVHTAMTDFSPATGFATAPLTSWKTNGSVQATNNSIVIGFPNGASVTTSDAVGVIVDLGSLTAKRAVVNFTNSGVAASTHSFYCLGSSDPSTIISAGVSAFSSVDPSSATSPQSGTMATAQRYIAVLLFKTAGGTATETTDRLVKITAIQLFGSASWESGNTSILKASDVVKDLIALCPLLSTSTALISTSSFSIPDLYVSNPSTPGEIMRAVNAYHDWLLQVDQYRQVVFAAKPTVPVISIGQWSSAQIQDTSAGTSTDVYNKALLSATGPDGTPLLVSRTSTSTLLSAQGITRTKSIPINGPMTTAALNQLGDTFLSSHSTQPFKGSITGKGTGAFRSLAGGAAYAPYLVPTLAGQLLRLDHWIDPDTGGLGRDGRIAEATYTVDNDTVTASLDNTRSNFEAFLGRLQILTQSTIGQ